MGVKIIGTGSYTPANVVSNKDLERMVDTDDEWISSRTGISGRRIASEGETPSTMGVQAARRALEVSGLSGESIDLIVFATVTPDMQFPCTACLVQREIKAARAACFDLQAACSGFLYSLEAATSMMAHNKRFKRALVIGGEKLSACTDWTDRNTCILFGDGAGAVVLEKSLKHKNALMSSILCADGNSSDLLKIPFGGSKNPFSQSPFTFPPEGGAPVSIDREEPGSNPPPATIEAIRNKMHCIKMDGRQVFKQAVYAMIQACKEAMAIAKIGPDDVAWLVPHQANLRIIKSVGEYLSIPESRVYINVDRYGNTSAASIPIALDELCRGGHVKPGDKILLTAFGGGMTWGASVLQF